MQVDPSTTMIYHITNVSNLPGILASGGIYSDARMRDANLAPTEIGFASIKARRLGQYRIDCCNMRFVGEFVPFYFCPKSPMLYTINRGNTGHPAGCQKSIVYLVSYVQRAFDLGQQWAVSDGNAGAAYTTFSNDAGAIERVNWEIVKSNSWGNDRTRMHTKSTELLVADFFPITSLVGVACQNEIIANEARAALAARAAGIEVKVIPQWYF